MKYNQANIRNFSIIAHIDHGKTTLADRYIQITDGLSERELQEQTLDTMDIERERGITIKSQCVTLFYKSKNGNEYQLNFIDTPGHVDFAYEVSRSLFACEGSLLIVDAAQGVEAQSVSNCYKAIEQNLVVLPILNKIDLPQADPNKVKQEIEEIIGLETDNVCLVSAKTGIGIAESLEMLIKKIPAPSGNNKQPLKALIIDSWFDNYLGVVVLIRIKQGSISSGDSIFIKSTKESHKVDQIGIFTPKRVKKENLMTGEVGYLVASIKNIHGAPVGDTITHTKTKEIKELPGFQKIKPMVYAGIFTTTNDQFEDFREALEKLVLNDSSLQYEPETSDALGHGFRCGFLGLLHLEIIQERLEREYNLNIITTAPNIVYEILLTNNSIEYISKPSSLPAPNKILEIREPIYEVSILCPADYIGKIITLCIDKRGTQKQLNYMASQVNLVFEIPASEVITDFFDKLKSISRGYASFDFNFIRYQKADLVKMDILINGNSVDALSLIIHRIVSRSKGLAIAEKMKTLIPRQMFDIAIQAAIGGNIIARQTVKAYRKNVLAKCYGGDVTRKRKLLEKQKAGKKRMKQVGNIEIPQEAFLSILKSD